MKLEDVIKDLRDRATSLKNAGSGPFTILEKEASAGAMEQAAARLERMAQELNAATEIFSRYEEGHLAKAELKEPRRLPVPANTMQDVNVKLAEYRLDHYHKAYENKVAAARCRSAAL